ncbi:MAG: protein phosphatase 2C domain-containing protein [Myxococcaceae bacterium]
MNVAAPHRGTSGSIRGRDHALSLRNNQDGLAVRSGEITVAVVTDGCSSGASNEAGAKLGAEVLANAVAQLASAGIDAQLAVRASDRLFAWLYESARALTTGEPELAKVVERFFLFSFLCAVGKGDQTLIFGIGDGVWSVDGVLHVIDSGPENAPAYLGYRALPLGIPTEPVIHHLGPARSVLIATDGLAGALAHDAELPRRWFSDALTFSNPAQLGRQLVVLAEQKKWLRDDTTVALLEAA